MIKLFCEKALWEKIKDAVYFDFTIKEWVSFADIQTMRPSANANHLIVENGSITCPVDWQNAMPPYILPDNIPFKEDILMALVMLRLGEFDHTLQLSASSPALKPELKIIMDLMIGGPIDPNLISVETYQEFDDYRLMHNHAIVRHYGDATDLSKMEYYYREAIDSSPSEEYAAFSAFHYFNFLFDQGRFEEAESQLRRIVLPDVSQEGKMKLQASLAHLHTTLLSPPYDEEHLNSIKELLWQCITFYDIHGFKIEEAQCLLDAGFIASISKSFSEALGYFTNAVKLFQDEEMEEFAYQALLQKARLLTTWAQHGNPQFYKPAIEAYQQASKFFKKEYFPLAYAEIQENLGIIYSEIPDEAKKKSVWAAVSASSFTEALTIFTKEEFPLDFARVCTHYGIALMKYPQAVRTDNFVKALSYFQEALSVRTADEYPLERSITLLNYLEACWNADNSSDENNPGRLHEMQMRINEVIEINAGEEFVQEARTHQEKLNQLKSIISGEGEI
jgi:tetratricopeptide (TPR) repeat protein